MSTTEPNPYNDDEPPVDGPVMTMDWGEDADAGGQYKIAMDREKTIDDYYYRDSNGNLQLQPEYKARIDRARIDWWGVAHDLAIIIFGSVGGAGSSVWTAISVTGGSGVAAYDDVNRYKKKNGS